MKRALSWGKRSVTGKIVAPDEETDKSVIDLSRVKIAKIDAKAYRKQQEQSASQTDETGIFSSSVNKNTDPERIKELQVILSRLSYYHGDIDGKYSKVLESAISDFQIENRLVASKKTYGAGFYGAATRAKLREVYALYAENEKKRIAEEARVAVEKAQEEKRLALEKAEREKQKESRKAEVTLFVKNLGTPKPDEVGVHVRNLQQSLKSLGYFPSKDTAIFGKNTQAALIRYQTDRKIASEEFGKLGKSTKEALYRDLLALKEKQGNELAWNGK